MGRSSISQRIASLNSRQKTAGAESGRKLFKSQKRQSTVDIVLNSFRQLLLSRKLLPGQRVPSENEICDGLGVSRGSVREAMKILSAFGVVEIKVGDGTYIPTEPKPAIFDPLLFSFLVQDPDIQEVTEFRRLLELDTIELILANKEKNGYERDLLEANLRQMEELRRRGASKQAFGDLDMEFHRLLGRAACNKLIQRIYEFALDFLENTIKETQYRQENGAISYEVHRRIVESIRQNDLDLAHQAISYSVDVWRNLQSGEEQAPE